jgi:hypothetical protein
MKGPPEGPFMAEEEVSGFGVQVSGAGPSAFFLITQT